MTKSEHVYAICCRPEVAGDVISGENVKTSRGYAVLNFEDVIFNNFRDIKKLISRRRRTATITISENAFEFRLKGETGKQLRRSET